MKIDIAEAKRRLTIPRLWEMLGLPGEPSKLCRSPFREDRSPSFSVYADGRRFKDFSTGLEGDAVDFLAEALELSAGDACRKFIELAGGETLPPVAMRQAKPKRKPERKGKPILPELSRGTFAQWERLAAGRGFSIDGIRYAVDKGLLRFAEMFRAECWLVLDGTRQNAQARRLDGLPFIETTHLPARKSHTIAGSRASWPLGLPELAKMRAGLIVEGGPDLIAACDYIAGSCKMDVAPIAILGAAQRFTPDALAACRGRRLRIIADADTAGAHAADRWRDALEAVGAAVDVFDLRPFLPPGGTDLNDALIAGNLNAGEVLP